MRHSWPMARVRKGPPTPHPRDPSPAASVPERTVGATSSIGDTSTRIALPSDLPASLQYLDDAQLDTLLHAVEAEARRRGRPAEDEVGKTARTAKAAPSEAALRRQPRANKRTSKITPGQASIIRAAFEAGVKPSAIARQFRISRAQVDRIVVAPKKGGS